MKSFPHLFVSLVLLSVALFAVACESEEVSAGNDLQVSPNYKEISWGQSVVLSASGAKDYAWHLEDDGIGGALSSTKGSSVVYTAPKVRVGATEETRERKDSEGNVTTETYAMGRQVISVVGSYGAGVVGASTNETSSALSATVTIVVYGKK